MYYITLFSNTAKVQLINVNKYMYDILMHTHTHVNMIYVV